MHDDEEENLEFRLTISIDDAFAFSMGEFHLGSSEVSDTMRQLVGILIVDALQYGEHWRVAAEAQASLAERWPDCQGFRSSCPS